MNRKPVDIRPKVISFPQCLEGLNIAAKQSVLLPCHAFSIILPQKKKNGLNVFEETVLKLTEIQTGNTKNLAELMCLNKDKDGKESVELVSFIQNLLQNMGFVDKRYELTKYGKSLLESWRNSENSKEEDVSGTMFLDLLTGKLIPYLHIGQLEYETISSISNTFITITTGSTGNKKKINSYIVSQGNDSNKRIIPNSNAIIKAIRAFRKQYKMYALLKKDIDSYPPPVPMAEAISVNTVPEFVFLRCEALIQIGNTDLIVTDGCGYGFSDSFARYLTSQDMRWVHQLKKKGVIEKHYEEHINIEITNRAWKYPEVTKIFTIDSLLNKLSVSPDTTDKEREYIVNRQKVISKLYSALEWTLRYAITKYPVDEWEQIYKSQNFKDNERLLCSFAEKIGFLVKDSDRSILQVKAGAINQIQEGKVVLQPLLAVAITGAAQKYPDHPFHLLSMNHSDFLWLANQLKKLRDPIEHGGISDYKVDSDKLRVISEKVTDIIVTLLPDIVPELNIDITKDIPKSDINQERLKVEVELESKLGLSYIYEISYNLKELLIRSELMLLRYTENNNTEIIKCYASIIQLCLLEAIKDRRLPKGFTGDFRDIAIEKVIGFGFYTENTAVPIEITTVGKQKIMNASQCKSESLGAQLLAIFLLGSNDELIHLRSSFPEFIAFVAKLIKLRGHGNEQQYNLSQNKMKSIKNDVFSAIKIIKEVF